uniref:Uncharacterized protein n=1 Tax=Pararge aegeria TaxID=116150 RepID=S4NWU0_9NEOP
MILKTTDRNYTILSMHGSQFDYCIWFVCKKVANGAWRTPQLSIHFTWHRLKMLKKIFLAFRLFVLKNKLQNFPLLK